MLFIVVFFDCYLMVNNDECTSLAPHRSSCGHWGPAKLVEYDSYTAWYSANLYVGDLSFVLLLFSCFIACHACIAAAFDVCCLGLRLHHGGLSRPETDTKDVEVRCITLLHNIYISSFYARQHICYSAYMLSPVRPSVRQTVKVRIMKFLPYGSPSL